MRVILASKSPRRKELLKSITQNFEIIVSNSDERFQEGLAIEEQAKRIAYLKAKTVFDQTQGDREEYSDYDTAKVYISTMNDKEIQNWINSGKAMDKAGAYAVQEEFSKFIERIDGNYATVVGLSIHKVYQVMKQYLED